MAVLMTSPEELQRRRSELLQRRQELLQSRGHQSEEIETLLALSECSFRIAVHPETPFEDTLELLNQCIRLDGANPRYAYHLGRLYFVYGQFDRASHWFRLACCLSPTSHRIWSHVAILLRELNAQYVGNDDYEPNALLKRSEQILKHVREGQDTIDPDLLDFVPPESLAAKEREERLETPGASDRNGRKRSDEKDRIKPASHVKRYVAAKRCRWSGIEHLALEQQFEGRASQTALKKFLPAMRDLARTASRHPGKAAAVRILAVQMLLAGYPSESVRWLMEFFPQDDNPSAQMLETVCAIFESSRDQVAAQIVRAVETADLPPLTAALIHNERLLWHSMEYRNLGTYRSAQRFLARQKAGSNGADTSGTELDESSRELAVDLTRRLSRAIQSLNSDPPRALRHEAPKDDDQKSLDPQSLLTTFEAYVHAAAQLREFLDEGFRTLKDGLDPETKTIESAEAFASALASRAAVDEFLGLIAENSSTGMQRLERLLELLGTFSTDILGDDFAVRREECIRQFQDLQTIGNYRKVLKRIDKRLRRTEEQFESSPAQPSTEWAALLEGVRHALPDEAPADADSPASTDFVTEASENVATLERDWDRLRELVAKNKVDGLESDELIEAAGIRDRFDGMKIVSESRLQEIDSILQAGDVAGGEDQNLEGVQNQYREIIQAQGRFRKNFRKLPDLPEAASESAGNPISGSQQGSSSESAANPDGSSEKAESVSPDETESNGHSTTAAPAKAGSAAPSGTASVPEELTPTQELQRALDDTDRALGNLFRTHEAEFAQYPDWVMGLPPFHALRNSLRAREAEVFYRLGNRRRARKIWSGMLAIDRLDTGLLRNIAVCDTVEGDIAGSLSSWQSYVEMLYSLDVFMEDASRNAATRAEFHRAFGDAFAPTFLSEPFSNEWPDSVDSAALISFLSSPGRVRSFVNHRLLEFLNTRFEFTSPSLVIGLKRIEAANRREEAGKALCAFAKTGSGLLPVRVAEQYTDLAIDQFEKTVDVCASVDRLTLAHNRNYEDEEKRQLELLIRTVDIYFKLALSFSKHAHVVRNLTSFGFAAELARLEEIPVHVSPELYALAAAALGQEPEDLKRMPGIMRENMVAGLMRYLFSVDDEPAERPIRERQYQLMITDWFRRAEFSDAAKLADTGIHFWPESIVELWQQDSIDRESLDILLRWCRDYPHLGTMSYLVANLLIKRNELDEAEQLLKSARPKAFHPPARQKVRALLAQLRGRDLEQMFDQEQYSQACSLLAELVDEDDFMSNLPLQLINLYRQAVAAGQHLISEDRFNKIVEGWLQRATELLAQFGEDHDEFQTAGPDEIESVRNAWLNK